LRRGHQRLANLKTIPVEAPRLFRVPPLSIKGRFASVGVEAKLSEPRNKVIDLDKAEGESKVT
jgi:hypothetical protein